MLAFLLSSHRVGLVALLLDALVLWLTGPTVEDALGRVRFTGLCLFGGLFALATWALADGSSLALFCASGVTIAVLMSYLLLYPRARVLTLVTVPFFTTIIEIPTAIVIGLWLVLQLWLGFAGLR